MAFQRVGILSIGEMGYHWARLLAAHGVEVLTCSEGRSEVSRKRADNAGVKSLPSMIRLVSEAELIVSIVVPFAAKKVAAQVAKALIKVGRKDFLFADVNAISTMTATDIGRKLSRARASFVDGCIIGSAVKLDRGAVIYLSGPRAKEVQALGESGFSVRVLGDEIAQASAFKIVYAGLTKGLQGLFVELLVGAKKFGLLEEILQRYDESFPGLAEQVGRSISSLPIHAGRRAEEMVELRQTFRHQGLKAVVTPSVEKILREMAFLRAGKASETGARGGTFVDTIELFFQKGLLQAQASRETLSKSANSDSNVETNIGRRE
ncbi:MAG: DUF1932 domain-containing protein [Candidatus Binatia bacterium]|nr:DUF1932 domain-containing protein [Candidatus Binatia bacterium]